ncbi:cytochrome P450 10 [Nematostella vectensis]|uniref:cytochrome P450 10 n=1 Tax=Nematostella vectensis TaxID=45351 RepID=UPI0020772494|nr:cytochrome P450 10 [Nematostella vectensis]
MSEKDGFKKMFRVQKKLFDEYGPIYKENLFGRTSVNILYPAESEKVFRAEGKYPSRPYVKAWKKYREDRGIHAGIAQTEGKEWKRVRQALAPKMMRPRELHDNIENFYEVVDDAMSRLQNARQGRTEGEVDNLEEHLFYWATESIGTMAFDTRIGLYEDPPKEDPKRFIECVHEFFEMTQNLELSMEKSFFEFMDTPSYKKFCRAQDDVMRIGQKYIDMKMVELEEMAKSPEEMLEEKAVPILTYMMAKKELSPHEINISAIEMFMAGVDTTSNTMVWSLYNLARNPDAQEKLYQEINSVIGKDGYLTVSDLGKIPYTRAALRESMRLNPVIFMNVRQLNKDIVLSGYHVPAGTLIQMPIYSACYSEQLFHNPTEYKPDRWLRDGGDDIHAFAHLPFGFGPRMCLGRRVAELEIFLFLSKLVQKYRFDYHHEPVMKLLMLPERPVKINFIERKN